MDHKHFRKLARYTFALLIPVLVLVLRLELNRWLPMEQGRFLMFVGAITLSAWIGGFWTGLLTTVVSVALIDYYLFPPPGFEMVHDSAALLMLTTLLVMGILISLLGQARLKQLSALSQSEEVYRVLFEFAPDGRGQVDPKTRRFLRVNRRLCELTGYPAAELLGMTAPQLTLEEDRARDEEANRHLLNGAVPAYAIEKRYRRKDGTLIWVQVTVTLIRDPRGSPRFIDGCVRDISAQKRAEEESERQRRAFQNLAEHSPDIIARFDRQLRHLYVNPAVEQITGLRPEQFMGKTNAELGMAESQYAVWNEATRRVFAEGVMDSIEFSYRDGGETRFFHAVLVPEFDADGRVETVLGITRDVTEFKRAEAAVRASEQRVAGILESITDSYYALDFAWRIIAINERAAAYTHLRREELLGRNFFALFPQFKDSPLHQALDKVMRERTPVHNELASRIREGLWAENHIYPSPEGVEVYFRNITERKQTEEALRARNERLTLLSEAAGYLLQERNPEPMIKEVFVRVARHLELDAYTYYVADETIHKLSLESTSGVAAPACGCTLVDFDQTWCGTAARERRMVYLPHSLHSDDPRSQELQRIGARAYVCYPLLAGEHLFGTLAFVSLTRETFDEDEREFLGTICHYLAAARERAHLERELNQKVEALAEADRRKDEFLAMLAHELRNPLAPIRNAVQIIRLGDIKSSLLQRQREVIDRQVTHMAHLLDDLLDVSRITRGKIELRRRPIALTEIFDRSVEIVKPLLEARHHAFSRAEATGLYVDGDPDRLTQIVGNLLTNAAKYTEEGGKIELEARHENGQAVLVVRDNGMGIAPEMLSQIFDLFTQANRTLDRSQGGLGIGLTLVRNLVQMHGGQIEAHSGGLGRGSEFIVRLPLVDASRLQPGESVARDAAA